MNTGSKSWVAAAAAVTIGVTLSACTSTASPRFDSPHADDRVAAAVATLSPRVGFTTALAEGDSSSGYTASGVFDVPSCDERGSGSAPDSGATESWNVGGAEGSGVNQMPPQAALALGPAVEASRRGGLCSALQELPFMLKTTSSTPTTVVADWDPVRAENVRRAQLYDAMLTDADGDVTTAVSNFTAADSPMDGFYRKFGPLTFTLTNGRLTRVSVPTRDDPGTPVFAVDLAPAPVRPSDSPTATPVPSR